MRRLLILFFIFLSAPAFAIDWISVTTPKGNTAYLDKDSIKLSGNYYFYNIKVKKDKSSDYSVVTIQSAKKAPFSARIKHYTVAEYEALKGDYENIENNKTKNLEPVTFESTVNTCYMTVKKLTDKKDTPLITF